MPCLNPLSRPVRDKPGNEKIPQPKPQNLFALFYLYKFAFFSKLAFTSHIATSMSIIA